VAPAAALPLFIASLAITLLAARSFARRLDRLGARFGFPEALVGLLTALAADGPEVSSALFALARGEHGVGVGVVVGSNAFNLAAMIGLSALLAGGVRLTRDALLLEGLVGVAVTLIGGAVLLGWLAPLGAAILAAAVLLPYLLVVIGGSELLAHAHAHAHGRGANPNHLLARLARALEQRSQEASARHSRADAENPTHHLLALVVVDVALIVAGSAGMVQAALALGDHWGISTAILGAVILAPLTSVPNALTGVRLGLAGRGAALVGEAFNSNTINLTAGVIVPSLFIALASPTASAKLELGWLLGMTCWCLAALARGGGMRRPEAAALIGAYGGFLAIVLR